MTAEPATRYESKFDQLFEQGRQAVLDGSHHRDTPPVDGGSRWGISLVLRPDPAAVSRLHTAASQAMAVAGAAHWPTGSAETVHVTVLPLERHRTEVPDGDPRVARTPKRWRAWSVVAGRWACGFGA